MVNSIVSHFYKYQTYPTQFVNGRTNSYNAEFDDLPDLPLSNTEEWRVVQRNDVHAGVLTTLGFLRRFASHRQRANRFYTAFRCEPFLPPAGGLPTETDPNPSPNLRERKGCEGCHNTLEPAAAVWGRWRAGSSYGYLNETIIPDINEIRNECQTCGQNARRCPAHCRAFFVNRTTNSHPDEQRWLGYLKTRAWLSEDEARVIDRGPQALVDEPEEELKIAQCTVRNLTEHLLGRELQDSEITQLLPQLIQSFQESNHNFTELVRDIVNSSTYRTTR